MGWIAVAVICVIVALIGFNMNSFVNKKFAEEGDDTRTVLPGFVGVIALTVLVITTVMSATYTQDPGEAKVLRSFTGQVVGVDADQGLGFKAPWVSTVDFDIRNQQVSYNGRHEEGGNAIQISDRDKVTGHADIDVRYSINPANLVEIYSDYSSEEFLQKRLIDRDITSVVRNIFSEYTTVETREKRNEINQRIDEALRDRWGDNGVIVESVALQALHYPQATEEGFVAAQESATRLKAAEADVKVKRAEGDQRKAEAEANAEVKRINAEAEAKANATLDKSLSDKVLQKQYIDALRDIGKDGNLVVVPEGSTPMVNTGKKSD